MAKIKIDLGDVCMALQSSEEQDWYLDRETGEMNFYSSLIDNDEIDMEEIEGNPDRYCWIESVSSDDGYRLMEEFVDGLGEGEASRSWARALRMRKPFRCFKDTLLDFPEVRDQWFAFHNARLEDLAHQLLKDEGIDYEVVGFSGESAD